MTGQPNGLHRCRRGQRPGNALRKGPTTRLAPKGASQNPSSLQATPCSHFAKCETTTDERNRRHEVAFQPSRRANARADVRREKRIMTLRSTAFSYFAKCDQCQGKEPCVPRSGVPA